MNTELTNKNDDINIIQEELKTNANEELEKEIFTKLIKMYFPDFNVKLNRTFETSKDFLTYLFTGEHRDIIFSKAIKFSGYYYREECEEFLRFGQAMDLLFKIKKDCGVLEYSTIIKTINEAFGINSNLEINGFDDFVNLMFHKEAELLDVNDTQNITLTLFEKYRYINVKKNVLFNKLQEKYEWCHKLVEPSEEEEIANEKRFEENCKITEWPYY